MADENRTALAVFEGPLLLSPPSVVMNNALVFSRALSSILLLTAAYNMLAAFLSIVVFVFRMNFAKEGKKNGEVYVTWYGYECQTIFLLI